MKVRIAVPFIQFDVYEIEVPEGITVEAIMDQFDTERSEDKLDKPDTYDVGCLQDYNDDNGEAYPFIIDDEDLDRYTLVEKGPHPKHGPGLCPVCNHYGDDCTGE